MNRLGSIHNSAHEIRAPLYMNEVPRQNRPRPLTWLQAGLYWVDLLMNLGHQAIKASICHMSTRWSTAPFSINIYNTLIPHEHIWSRLHDGADLPAANLSAAMDLGFCMLEPSARPVPLMSASDLTGWWARQLFLEHLESVQLYQNLTKVDFLVVAGVYQLEHEFELVCVDTAEVGCCLSMIGAGALSLISAVPCDLCLFRCATLGTRRCGACSRSKRVVDSGAEMTRAADVRRSRTIRAEVLLPFDTSDEDLNAKIARSIACLLYSMPVGGRAHSLWLAKVKEALIAAPAVCAWLQPHFLEMNHRAQLKALQAAIDPNEWDYAAWPRKIAQAQAWIDGAAAVCDRRRGPGVMRITIERAAIARALIESGESKTAVARRLGISISNLSHVLRRSRAQLDL